MAAQPPASTAHETNDDNRILWCLVKGDAVPFAITTPLNSQIYNLKLLVHNEKDKGVLRDVNAAALILLKASRSMKFPLTSALIRTSLLASLTSRTVEKLKVWKFVSDYWSLQPPSGQVDVFAVPPTENLKRRRESGERTNSVKRLKDYGSQVSYPLRLPLKSLIRWTSTPLQWLFWDDSELMDFQRLWKRVWLAQEDPFQEQHVLRDADRVVDVEVPETCKVLSGLPDILRYGDVLVSKEYEEALEAIQGYETRLSAVLVVGHPGIGKTIFLYFLLAHRLFNRQPTLFQYEDESIILFDDNGVSRLSPGFLSRQSPTSSIWALVDDNPSVSRPARMLLRDGSPFFAIVATSPRSTLCDQVAHYKPPYAFWFMKPFTLVELIQARHLQAVKREEKDLQRFFELYGSSARECYAYCVDLPRYRRLVEEKIKAMTWPTITDILNGTLARPMDFASHRVILISPDPDNRGIHCPRITTKEVARMICGRDTDERWRNVRNLYRSLRLDPQTRTKSNAGWLLELPFHALCVKGASFNIYRLQHTSEDFYTNVHQKNEESLDLPAQELVVFDYSHPIEELRRDHYYQPAHGTQSTFDSFIYDPTRTVPRITMFQVTDGDQHDVKPIGIGFLRKLAERLGLPVPKLRYVVIIAEGDRVRVSLAKEVGLEIEVFCLEVSDADLFPR